MFKQKEIFLMLIVAILFGLIISLMKSWELFLTVTGFSALVILINVITKKIVSYHLDSEIEIKLWEWSRWGFKPSYHFKRPLQAGILVPLFITIISAGNLVWLASLVFDIKSKVYSAAKRFGLYSFSEVSEFQIGIIAASGVIVNLIFALAGYLLNFPLFAKINIFFAFFNMIPLSDLDGNKIFFGSVVLWSFLAAIVLIAMGYVLFIV